MKNNQRITQADVSVPLVYDNRTASCAEAGKRKSQMGFLYLFVALARRAYTDKGIQELQSLSGLIEAEIQELKKDKSRSRLRDVLRKNN